MAERKLRDGVVEVAVSSAGLMPLVAGIAGGLAVMVVVGMVVMMVRRGREGPRPDWDPGTGGGEQECYSVRNTLGARTAVLVRQGAGAGAGAGAAGRTAVLLGPSCGGERESTL